MSLELWHIGKKRNDEYESLTEQYSKRLRRYTSIKTVILKDSKAREPGQRIREESGLVLDKLQPSDHLIMLDEKGRNLTTDEFARQLSSKWMQEKRTVFLIGGSYGLSDAVRSRSNEVIALSKMVLPHQMARLMFTEQLYRAFTILNNENYHH